MVRRPRVGRVARSRCPDPGTDPRGTPDRWGRWRCCRRCAGPASIAVGTGGTAHRQAGLRHTLAGLALTDSAALAARQAVTGRDAGAGDAGLFGPQLMASTVLGSLHGSMQMPPEQTVGGGQRMPSQALTQVPVADLGGRAGYSGAGAVDAASAIADQAAVGRTGKLIQTATDAAPRSQICPLGQLAPSSMAPLRRCPPSQRSVVGLTRAFAVDAAFAIALGDAAATGSFALVVFAGLAGAQAG